MALNGYVKLYRRAEESWLWALPSGQFKVALTILAEANWRDNETMIGGNMVEIRRGQLVTSIASLSEKSGESARTVRTALTNLARGGFLTNRSTKQYRLISIVNYDRYQDPDSAIDKAIDKAATKQRQSSDKAATTTEEGKKGKKGRRKKKETDLSGFSEDEIAIGTRVLAKLSERSGMNFSPCKTHLAPIVTLLRGDPPVTESDLRVVVWDRWKKWKGSKWEEYLRPMTLFAPTNFHGKYLQPARRAWNELRHNGAEREPALPGILGGELGPEPE